MDCNDSANAESCNDKNQTTTQCAFRFSLRSFLAMTHSWLYALKRFHIGSKKSKILNTH
ncbi:hypothetical protein [Helicobacter rodentium]|uniref:hypothetical protein n=1 Tax=Helicobacter rodentium TaxID=59617 RepID=UPI0023562F5E|nr:hypothetical protein [Helicobacter rodentium]